MGMNIPSTHVPHRIWNIKLSECEEDDFAKNLIYKLDDVSICPLTGYLIVD